MIVSITTENFEEEVVFSSLPVIIDVYAIWCGPCKQMTPLFEELSQELGEVYKWCKLDVDEAREVARNLGIQSLPTFLFFKDKKLIGREIGYLSKVALKAKIEQVFK